MERIVYILTSIIRDIPSTITAFDVPLSLRGSNSMLTALEVQQQG